MYSYLPLWYTTKLSSKVVEPICLPMATGKRPICLCYQHVLFSNIFTKIMSIKYSLIFVLISISLVTVKILKHVFIWHLSFHLCELLVLVYLLLNFPLHYLFLVRKSYAYNLHFLCFNYIDCETISFSGLIFKFFLYFWSVTQEF